MFLFQKQDRHLDPEAAKNIRWNFYGRVWVGHVRRKNVAAATTPIATAIKNNTTDKKTWALESRAHVP
jgi:hypothetical protein